MRAIKRKGPVRPWTEEELIAVNDCYHVMLWEEKCGRKYVKKHEIERMMAGTQLDRSFGSVECRMMNISAVRNELELDRIQGYKPLSNMGANIREMLIPLVSSYENVWNHLNALQSGDEYQMYKASQFEQELGTA